MTPLARGVTPARRSLPWMPLALVAAAWLAQGPVLGNGWVWDDAPAVRDDPAVRRGAASVPAVLGRRWFGETDDVGLYRPLVTATLAIESEVHGADDPFGFHLTNLFLHGLVAVALLAVLQRALPGRPVATSAAALLFAVHPLHTGTVSWIVARGDLLAALFSCLAALVWLRPGPVRLGRTVLAALCVLLALLGKEMAAPLPLALLVLDLAVRREGMRGILRRGWAYLILLVPLAAWFALRAGATGSFGAAPGMEALAERSLVERAIVGAFGLARTAWNLAVPAGISADRSDDPLFEPGSEIPGAYVWVALAVVLATLVALARGLSGRARAPAAAWSLFVVLSLPVLQVVPLGTIHEDRFAYVPSLALLLLGGLAVERILAVGPRAVAAAGCVVALVSLVAASWAVAKDWRDDERFNEALLARNPRHRPALNRLGRHHADRGRQLLDQAAGERVVDPRQPRPLIVEANRHLGEAVRVLERAATLPSRRASASLYRNLGDARFELRDFPRAVVAYRSAIEKKRVRLDGRSVPWQHVKAEDLRRGAVAAADARFLGYVWYRLGLALHATDDQDQAIVAFGRAAFWQPDDGQIQRRAAQALIEAGRPADALPFLERAAATLRGTEGARAREDHEDIRAQVRGESETLFARGLAALRRADGQDEAIVAFQEAVTMRPNFVAARIELAKLHASWKGNLRAALEHLDVALRDLEEQEAVDGKSPEALRREVEALKAKYVAEWGKEEEDE